MTAFPNYTQIPTRLSVGAWQAIRVVTLLGAIALAMALVVVARRRAVRALEAGHPGAAAALARGARAVAQRVPARRPPTRRRACSGSRKALTAPDVAEGVRLRHRRGACSSLFVSLRKVGLDDSGPASALLLLGALSGGFVGGMLLKGKSGWCSSICPLLPIQRLYGQTPYKLVANSPLHAVRGLHEVLLRLQPEGRLPGRPQRPDPLLGRLPQALRRRVPGPRARVLHAARGARRRAEIAELYGQLALYLRRSVAVFYALDSLRQGLDPQAHDAVRAPPGFTLFYWYGGPIFVDAVSGGAAPDGGRLGRARRGDRARGRLGGADVRQGARVRRAGRRRPRRRAVGASRSPTSRRGARWPRTARSRGRARGHVRARGQARRGQAGHDAARGRRGRRAADRVGLPDGRLRRRPGVRQGRDGEPVGDLRRRALDARPARPRRQHAHGLLRARAGPGDDVARRRRSRAKPSRVADRRRSPSTARSSASSCSATASPASRRPTTCAAATRSPRSTSSPRSRTTSTTAWASRA